MERIYLRRNAAYVYARRSRVQILDKPPPYVVAMVVEERDGSAERMGIITFDSYLDVANLDPIPERRSIRLG